MIIGNTKKSSGYWTNFENVQREIHQFITEHGTPGMMPTFDQLLAFGGNSLCNAIQKHGGFAVVSKQLGLKSHYKTRGYWDNLENLANEINTFIAKDGSSGCMPTVVQLHEAGYYSLVVAINKHGGFAAVAEKLGLKSHYKTRGYWDDFENVANEINAFVIQRENTGYMPTVVQLHAAGCYSLAAAINKHGGFAAVARQIGLKQRYKARGYWDDFENVKRELLDFMVAHEVSDSMPSVAQLHTAGCYSLVAAINKHGGFVVVAEKLALQQSKVQDYWDDFENLKQEIHKFIDLHGIAGCMPTPVEILARGCNDIEKAINQHGGFSAVAHRLGLQQPRRLSAFWDGFAGSQQEVYDF